MELDFTIFPSFLPSVTSVGRWMWAPDGCVSYFEMIGGCQPSSLSLSPPSDTNIQQCRTTRVPEVFCHQGGRRRYVFGQTSLLGAGSPSTQFGRAADGGTFGPLSCGHAVGGGGEWEAWGVGGNIWKVGVGAFRGALTVPVA